MTAPPNSFSTNFGRFYAHPRLQLEQFQRTQIGGMTGIDQGPYAPKPSVTNIIGMMQKAFLPPLYAKLVAEYAVENLDAIRYSVDKFGPEVAKGTLKSVPNQPNKAAAIGDEVHAAIDDYVSNGVQPEGFETNTAWHMFEQFKYFATQYPMKVIRSEFTVWSYEHGYAGTGDLLVETSDGLEVWDTKTGNNLYPEVAMQTAALANADVILDSDGKEHPMPTIAKLGALHVRPRSVKLYELNRSEEAFEAFLACKRLFDWRRFDADQVLASEPFKTEKPKETK